MGKKKINPISKTSRPELLTKAIDIDCRYVEKLMRIRISVLDKLFEFECHPHDHGCNIPVYVYRERREKLYNGEMITIKEREFVEVFDDIDVKNEEDFKNFVANYIINNFTFKVYKTITEEERCLQHYESPDLHFTLSDVDLFLKNL